MKYTIELDTFDETRQRFELDGLVECFCRGRMKQDDKGNYYPYVEITAFQRIGDNDVVFYIFQEMLSTPGNFTRLEHETDEALMKRRNEFTKAWMETLDSKYIRGLQSVKRLKVWIGAVGCSA